MNISLGVRIVHAGKVMTPSDAEALILFLFYCLAVHPIHLVLERRKQR
jgi:hypothetical protein